MNLVPLSDDDKAWLTELQVAARAEYAVLTPDQQRDIDRRWADVPEHVKEDLRTEAEWDLL